MIGSSKNYDAQLTDYANRMKIQNDLSDQLTQNIFSETFSDLTKWDITGDPTYGTVTVASGVMSMADTSATGNLLATLKDVNRWGESTKPLATEIEIGGTAKIQVTLSYKGATDYPISTLIFDTNNTITHQVDVGIINTVTPLNFVLANKSRLLWLVDPVAKLVTVFLFYKSSGSGFFIVKLEAARAYITPLYPNRIAFQTSSTGTGTFTAEKIKVFDIWGVEIGDSIAAGHNLYDPIPAYYGTNDETSQSEYWFEQKLGGKRRVLNLGIGGQTTTQIIARIQTLIDLNPKLAIFNMGTNDILTDVAIATIKENILSALNSCKAANIYTVICTIPPCNNFTAPQSIVKNAVNAWLPSACLTYGAFLANTHSKLKDPANTDTLWVRFTSDGTHLTVAGYKQKTNAIWEAISNV